MIKSFRNQAAEASWQRRFIKGVPNDIIKAAHRKLTQIHNARDLNDLRAPPGNRLEALSTDRQGQHSIRINDQWRVCFEWRDGDAYNVERLLTGSGVVMSGSRDPGRDEFAE